MRAIGLTLIREPRRLGYPFAQTIASFRPLHDYLVIGDGTDPDVWDTQALTPLHTHAFMERWPTGETGIRAIVRHGLMAAKVRGATHVLWIDGDESMRSADVAALAREAPPVAYLPRWTFWRDMQTLRLDWTAFLPRWAAVDALLPSLERAEGDGSELPIRPGLAVAQYPQWPVFAYGRVGSPRHVARQRKATALMFAPESDLDVPEEYDFVPRRFDCWLKGRQQPAVPGMFARYDGDHPEGIREWYEGLK